MTDRRPAPPTAAWAARAAFLALGIHLLPGTAAGAPAAGPVPAAPISALPALDVAAYMGTWYQVALFPNFFQRTCVTDTTATYRDLGDGTIEVRNRCRREDGRIDEVIGQARPPRGGASVQAGRLQPARLEVRFAPAWLGWLPMVWGRYWVIQRADDGRYAVVSEPDREYLWVLSRTPTLSADDELAIRSRLVEQGFDLKNWQRHPHTAAR